MVQRFPITLNQLTYFAECAKTLNMTEASGQLHVAQSAVSAAITQLERSLGTALFIRIHSKGLVLTPTGESLLRDTHRLFEVLSDTIESVRANQNEVRGSINVACFDTLSPFLLPQLLSRLQAKHPNLTVNVIEGNHEENLAALRGGRVEISIGYNLSEPEGVVHEIVGEIRPHVILSTGHPLAKRRSVDLADLAEEPFVLLDLPGSSDYFLSILLQGGITPKLKYRSSGYETVRAMVAMGLGYSILNQRPRTNETYTGARTRVLEINDAVASLGIAVSTLEQIEHSARARAVNETIREILAEPLPPTM